MNERELDHVSQKNPVWRSMVVVNNAMEDTNTSYVSPIRPPGYELYKQHTTQLAREKINKKSLNKTEPIVRSSLNPARSPYRKDTPIVVN